MVEYVQFSSISHFRGCESGSWHWLQSCCRGINLNSILVFAGERQQHICSPPRELWVKLRMKRKLAKRPTQMPRTYTKLLVHIIFSTKERRREIIPDLSTKLHGYLWGIAKNLKCTPLAVNGTDDHVHMLVGIRPDSSLSDFVRSLKSSSSKWVHEDQGRPRFAWQLGFAALSVSKSNATSVSRYIAEQEEHHRRMSFQQELIAFLKKHEIEYDERYIWE
jgi:putative transposase